MFSEDQKKKKKRIRVDDDDDAEEEKAEEEVKNHVQRSFKKECVVYSIFSLGETTLKARFILGDVVATRRAQARAVVPRRQQ